MMTYGPNVMDGLEELTRRQEEARLQFEYEMRLQELIAIRNIVSGVQQSIAAEKAKLDQFLSSQAESMKTSVSTTFVNNIESGLSGKVADAATGLLKDTKMPDLKSPIKAGG